MVNALKYSAYIFLVIGILSGIYCLWAGFFLSGTHPPEIYYPAGFASLITGALSFMMFHSQSTILDRTELLEQWYVRENEKVSKMGHQ
jgi:flagellar motor component MotA